MRTHITSYLQGASLAAIGRGNRRITVALKTAAAKNGTTPTWKHATGVGGGVLFFWPVIGGWVPVTLTTLLTLWLLAAVIAGQPQADSEESGPAPAPLANQNEDSEEWIQEDPAPAVLWALIRHTAALSDQGTAAHLPDLLAEGQKRGEFDGWKQADLKAHLIDLGVPVVEKKKLTFSGSQRTRQAVLLEDLPEADPAPVPAVVRTAPPAHVMSVA